MELYAGGAARTPEAGVGDAFTWALRDPEWVSKLILMGLIGIIPIVGSMQLVGWMLTSLDNLRAGHQVLPPADFRYATRGLWVFLAGLVYGVALFVLIYGAMFLILFGYLGMFPAASHSSAAQAAAPLGFFFLMFTTMSGVFALVLVLYLFVPLVVLYADRKGFAGAFDWVGIGRALRISPRECLAAGGLVLVAYLISGLGTYLCYVGLLFTIPYSLTIVAWVLRWFELKAKPDALPN